MTADQAQQSPAKQPYNGMWISIGLGAYVVRDGADKSVFVSRSLEACHAFIDNVAISTDPGGNPDVFVVGSCIPDSLAASDKREEVSKEPPAMSVPKPTRIDAFRTSDGEVFFNEEDACEHEVTVDVEARVCTLYNHLFRADSRPTASDLSAWFQRNAKEIQLIATMMMEMTRPDKPPVFIERPKTP